MNKIKIEWLKDLEDTGAKQGETCLVDEDYAEDYVKTGKARYCEVKIEKIVRCLTENERKFLNENVGNNKKLKEVLAKENLEEFDMEYCKTMVRAIKQGLRDNKSMQKLDNEELIKILKRKDLFNEITEKELDKKIVKELPTRKTIFLCAQGRLVENCQIASYNLLVNDEAGTGKDYITSKTLEIIPKCQVEKKTRISPTVFTYWHNEAFEPNWTWDGKVFYTEDISEKVLNSEVFKVMCSSGSSATVVIRQRAYDINIKGKPVIITTTASSIPSPELTRRFEIINLDESIDQTKEIMIRHANYAKLGISPNYNSKYIEAMTLLKRVKVKIPYADKLHALFPANNVMMRTKFPRFLDLIKACAAFHQFQRKYDKNGFLMANWQDYEISSQIMAKMVSNKYFISLTRNQRKIIDFFEEMTSKTQRFSENMSKIREKMNNFMSLPSFSTNLSILAEYGLLEIKLENDERGREVEKYSLSESVISNSKKVLFPSFSVVVGKVSKVSNVNNASNATKEILQKTQKIELKIGENG